MNIITQIRKHPLTRPAVILLTLQFLLIGFLPFRLFSLTGGPSAPEVQGFQPAGVSDMVDLFTGDFQYNIPLMDVGGYPINISYAGGVGMDQEASWAGLGWSLNPGAVNRSMRGLPDDFNGDLVKHEQNIRPNHTWGASLSIGDLEWFGCKMIDFGWGAGVKYNNYKGFGMDLSLDAGINLGMTEKSSLNLGLGFNAGTQEGIDASASAGLSVESENKNKKDSGSSTFSGKLAGAVNSRGGLKAINVSSGMTTTYNSGKNAKKQDTYDATSHGNSSSLPIGSQSYTPRINASMASTSVMVHVGTGLEFKWLNGKARLTGYYNGQWLREKTTFAPAYGYCYSEKGAALGNSLLDLNRQNDGAFSDETPALPVPQFMYDIYTVSGQGVSGMYRPFRGDAGVLHDNAVLSTSFSANGGGDFGASDLVKGGINGGFGFSFSTSGNWSSGNAANEKLKFAPASGVSNETFWFKQAGEKAVIDKDRYDRLRGDSPVRVNIDKYGNASPASQFGPLLSATKNGREKRNQPFSILTVKQAKDFAVHPQLRNYIRNSPMDGAVHYSNLDRDGENHAQPDHFSEITIYQSDGGRYVYGTPAYQLTQRDVSFNAAGHTGDCSTGLIDYSPASGAFEGDNSKDNKLGADHYFDASETPAYAYSWLLTSVLSSDYVDRTLDGPTVDDFGDYTLFNYTRTYGGANPYLWRVPVQANKANFNPGFNSDPQDDKGNYSYGAKEYWLQTSIESKLFVAEFYTSPREDGYGVLGENGGLNTAMPSYKLDSISLFARCDREQNGLAAIPIKTVHFEYDYSLCPGVDNNANIGAGDMGTGKLTLVKIWFTYYHSEKGAESPYTFYYADPDHNHIINDDPVANYNPGYGMKEYDRWGNYQAIAGSGCNDLLQPTPPEFPYTPQDPALADRFAAAWCLSTIGLPSGGEIWVDFEADRYGYVQDRRAMSMLKVHGMGKTTATMSSPQLYPGKEEANLYCAFDLSTPVSSEGEFRDQYMRDENGNEMTSIYFRFLVDLVGIRPGAKDAMDAWEYVSGWAEVESSGVDPTSLSGGKYTRGFVQFKGVGLRDRKPADGGPAHPIAKAGWDLCRLYLSKYIYPGSDPKGTGESAFRGLIAMWSDIQAAFTGFNRMLRAHGFSQDIRTNKSWLRLYAHSHNKLGGGHRVKKVSIWDAWEKMGGSPGSSFEYGQEYSYTTTLQGSVTPANPGGLTISSGVASYEPMPGNEENPWCEPDAYENDRKFAPNDQAYLEKPYGQGFFPGPGVGYSRVEVKNLDHPDVTRTATGFVRHEFYTSKDFPVIVRNDPGLIRAEDKPSFIMRILNKDVVHHLTASQGFSVVNNDMHGKQKAQWVFPEMDPAVIPTPQHALSGVEYFYKTMPGNPKRLNNNVQVIYPTGEIRDAVVGKDFEFFSDFRENYTLSTSVEFAGNLDVSLFPLPPAPIPIPSLWVSSTSEETQFRSVATMKAVTEYGILDKVVAYDLGSTVSTENLCYDAETGEVLLTRTVNEWENRGAPADTKRDEIYAFTYPAHWGYDRMGPAYRNIGLSTATAHSTYLVKGDEISIGTGRYWVTEISPTVVKAMDVNGTEMTVAGIVTVLRSGRRNMQSVPMGTVTTHADPRVSGKIHFFSQVINAGTVIFSEDWDNFCECGAAPEDPDRNLFVAGAIGNYRPLKSMVYLTGRTLSRLNNNTNVRENGTFLTFDPFWSPPSAGGEWGRNPAHWTFVSEVTLFSPFGTELENRDTLDRFSAATYGFGHKLPTAVASNARYREIAFDSFEDYGCKDCEDDHFSFSEVVDPGDVSATVSHTGHHSLRVSVGTSVMIEKYIRDCVPDSVSGMKVHPVDGGGGGE